MGNELALRKSGMKSHIFGFTMVRNYLPRVPGSLVLLWGLELHWNYSGITLTRDHTLPSPVPIISLRGLEKGTEISWLL